MQSNSKLQVIVRTTNLLQHVLGGDRLEDVLLGRLLDLAPDQQFVQDEIRLLKVEDNVQLTDLKWAWLERTCARHRTALCTHAPEVLVEQLDVSVDYL